MPRRRRWVASRVSPEVEANRRAAAVLSKIIDRERYHALMRNLEKRDPVFAVAFRTAWQAIQHQAQQLLNAGNPELAGKYIVQKLRKLELKDLRKGRKEHGRPSDLTILQWYSPLLSGLKGLPAKGLDVERVDYLNALVKKIPLTVPSDVVKRWAAMRRKEEIARAIVCRKLRLGRTTALPKIISRAKKVRAARATPL